MKVQSVPRPGDVLFFNSLDVATCLSCLAQTKLDPDAQDAIRTFGHVAVAVTNLLALEAMPSDPGDVGSHPATFTETLAIGAWTGSELRAGVRLIPIADLVVPAMRSNKELTVLRTLDVDEEAPSSFNPYHTDVLRMLGSQYSVDILRASASNLMPKNLAAFINPKLDWTSVPADLATRIGIDSELRERIEARLPDYSFYDAARTYFCSQAVVRCLKIAGLLEKGVGTDLTTPTGLFRLLLNRKWLDVTVFYKCAPDAQKYLDMTPLAHSASYTFALAMTSLSIQQDAVDLGLGLIRSSLEAVTKKCNDYTR